jgi:hypothetical protein
VNVTPPLSGTRSAHSASPAQPANSSLADLLLADAPAKAASNFRTIAAALFGVGSSTPTSAQTLAKGVVDGKKTTGMPGDKSDNRKETPDPAFPGIHPELTVPLQNVPVPLIQVPPQSESADGAVARQGLNPGAKDKSTQPVFSALRETPQTTGDEPATNTAGVAALDQRISASSSGENDAPSIQPLATGPELKEGKQLPVPPTSLQPNVTTRKKDAESTKSGVERSQTPVDTQLALPAAAAGDAPPGPPVEQTPDASAQQILDSAIAAKGEPQSELANPNAATGSANASGRNAPISSAKIKGRDTKDSHMTPFPSGKPGFIQPGQIPGGSPNAAGNGKDSPGLSLSGHSGAPAKPAPLKQSADASSSPASLTDADGPDETLPTSASSPVTAKFVQGMNQSEFRVGMQSQEFGNIDIRTSVARHMFSAQISVEHGDMAKSMTAQLPGLYHRLADQQVAVGNIVIHGQNLETSSGLAQDAQRENWQSQGHGATKSSAEPVLPVIAEGTNSAGRLDIRI